MKDGVVSVKDSTEQVGIGFGADGNRFEHGSIPLILSGQLGWSSEVVGVDDERRGFGFGFSRRNFFGK